MPLGPQPRGARGTVGHPYSALNLRLALATFGLVACTVLAGVMFAAHYWVPGWILVALATIAVGDLVVIQARRRARRRVDPDEQSLFE